MTDCEHESWDWQEASLRDNTDKTVLIAVCDNCGKDITELVEKQGEEE